jgi:hypothetical protein
LHLTGNTEVSIEDGEEQYPFGARDFLAALLERGSSLL